MDRKKIRGVFCRAGLILAVAAVGTGLPRDGQAATPEPLALSYVPSNTGSWDLLVATDKGLFAKEGFDPQVMILHDAIQSAQLMVTGAVNMAVSQSVALLSAITHGAKEIAIISAPLNRLDWSLSARPEIKTAMDLKGKLVGTASLPTADSWLTRDWITSQGLKPDQWGLIVIGTAAPKFAALERGSIAAAILFQPLGYVAEEKGYPTLYHFSEAKRMPPLLYAVGREWAAKDQHGVRLARALVEAHQWLYDPANKAEAMAILQKHNKQDDRVTQESYDFFIGKEKLMNDDAAVEIAGLNTEIALMAANGSLPPGTTLAPDKFMLSKALGGLYH